MKETNRRLVTGERPVTMDDAQNYLNKMRVRQPEIAYLIDGDDLLQKVTLIVRIQALMFPIPFRDSLIAQIVKDYNEAKTLGLI